MFSIYKITNTANGNFYIGSSVNVRRRFSVHQSDLRKGAHHCEPLQRAWNKYGPDCFVFEVIENHPDAHAMADAENQWLAEHGRKRYFYNVGTRAGAAFLGRKHSEEAREKMSASHKGKKRRLGLSSSPEHRAKISAAMKGKKKSPEHIEKIRQRMIGQTYSTGRIVSEDEKDMKGRKVVEITTGLSFSTIVKAAVHFGIHRANLIRALRVDRPLQRGPCAGLHFRYDVA